MILAIVHQKPPSEVFKIKRISGLSLNFKLSTFIVSNEWKTSSFQKKSPILVNYHIPSNIIIQLKD